VNLGWQFNIEYWYFFLVLKVFAKAQGSLEHGAFIVVGGGLQAFQDTTIFFGEVFFQLLFCLLIVLRGIGMLVFILFK
jgi:hypothetical protein